MVLWLRSGYGSICYGKMMKAALYQKLRYVSVQCERLLGWLAGWLSAGLSFSSANFSFLFFLEFQCTFL